MKFIVRSLLVFAAAVGLGVILYFAVQALPNESRPANPPANETGPQNSSTLPESQTSRPDRPENNRGEGIRWNAMGRIARRMILFSAIVFVAVLAKKVLFGRATKKIRKG